MNGFTERENQIQNVDKIGSAEIDRLMQSHLAGQLTFEEFHRLAQLILWAHNHRN